MKMSTSREFRSLAISIARVLYSPHIDFTTQAEQTEALKGVLSMLKIYLKGRRNSEQAANRNLMQMKVAGLDNPHCR